MAAPSGFSAGSMTSGFVVEHLSYPGAKEAEDSSLDSGGNLAGRHHKRLFRTMDHYHHVSG